PNYIIGPGPDTPILIGCILEVIVAFAGVGTALALYPLVKRQNHGLALGFVAARTVEAGTIIAGVVSLLVLVALRKAGVGASAPGIGQMLVTLYDKTFLLGQSLLPVVNAVLLGTLLYRSRLVPRFLPVLAFIGAPLLLAGDAATLFGVIGRSSGLAGLLALPDALWEFLLGVWLVVRGFTPSPLTAVAAGAKR
ncbi:MAG TPA: DUF4386 domain-containing protein, partial [Spirochaetia bacterium]|nr:DUF4386 domain-containing protein [Spirochaetia bacterium]